MLWFQVAVAGDRDGLDPRDTRGHLEHEDGFGIAFTRDGLQTNLT